MEGKHYKPERPIWKTNGTYRTSPFAILPVPPPIDPEVREKARKAAMAPKNR